MFTVKSKGTTDVGMVRSINQDSYLADNQLQLYIVADGMGGHVGGEIASSLCVKEIHSYMQQTITPEYSKYIQNSTNKDLSKTDIAQKLITAINNASCKIYEKALEQPQLKGMGTTASVLFIHDDVGYVAHVGDSRIYLIRAGFIYQITTDHSFVNEQVKAGILTEEEAKHHQARNIITRSVGYQEEEEVDTKWLQLEDGDLFVMCSDGLHGKVADEEISKMVTEKELQASETLVQLANSRGGNDNITVVVIKIEAEK